jgi:hypothetical protein
MSTINNPRPQDAQAGDTVYLSHPKVTGEVGVRFDGTHLDFPTETGSIEEALAVGFTLVRIERVERDKITIKGEITGRAGRPDTLKVVAILPSGKEKVLYTNGIGIGSREATIDLIDFAN